MKPIKIEICTNTVESAVAAQKGGADSIELCDNLLEGGTTSSFATIAKTRALVTIELHPIIRPRGGDFLYNQIEFELCCMDIEICKKIGCDGVVIGILTEDGNIDKVRCKELVELAKPLKVTFHRAFDVANNQFEALENIIEIGFDRILTAGGQNTALEGTELIKQLIQKANDRINIIVGAGVRKENIAELVHKTQATYYHSRASIPISSKMKYRRLGVIMNDKDKEFENSITDSRIVKELREIAEEAWKK